MNGEFNLELYTIAMTRLNNGFGKIGNIIQDNASALNMENEDDERDKKFSKMTAGVKRALPDFTTALKEFKELYADIQSDLNQKEIRLDDYEPFFKHVVETFPKSSKDLEEGIKGIKEATANNNEELKNIIAELGEIINQTIAIFTDIYSLSANSLEKINKGELK